MSSAVNSMPQLAAFLVKKASTWFPLKEGKNDLKSARSVKLDLTCLAALSRMLAPFE